MWSVLKDLGMMSSTALVASYPALTFFERFEPYEHIA